MFQSRHLLPVASIGVGNVYIISEENKLVYENKYENDKKITI